MSQTEMNSSSCSSNSNVNTHSVLLGVPLRRKTSTCTPSSNHCVIVAMRCMVCYILFSLVATGIWIAAPLDGSLSWAARTTLNMAKRQAPSSFFNLKPFHQSLFVFVQAFPVSSVSSASRHHFLFVSRKSGHQSPKRRCSSALFVFERMSEDCISALVTAQQQTSKLQLETVDTPAILAGCVNHPESTALSNTLKRYGITWRRVETGLSSLYVAKTDVERGWLSGFKAAAAGQEDRPFSTATKFALQRAGKIADAMNSKNIASQHVFLALLDYQEGSTLEKQRGEIAASATDSNDVWQVLVKLNVLDANVTALDICATLLQNLKMDSSTVNGNKELVTGQGGSDNQKAKTPTLAEVGVDLTQQAALGLLDPVFGRDAEIRASIRTLIRRRKNNVVLIGDAGVGKTAIAEGIAQVLADPLTCPTPLRGHRVVSVELASLVAGTKYRGEFEERLQAIVAEVTNPKSPPTILFLDEIHNLVGAGSAEGGLDAANLLKPALARGSMQVIGATTIAEYRKYIEKDAALERRLQPVMVKEPTVPQTIAILQAVQGAYEKHHTVQYSESAIIAAAELSERYINDRFLPDKALDLLDEAGALAQLEFHDSRPLDEEGDDDRPKPIVTEQKVVEVISEWSGIPMGKLERKELERLRSLEGDMERRVKGQDRAIRGVARAIRRARSGLRDPKRPVASFLFCGPTGTGKTELCKTLAETYYGAEKDMIRIDMSEYMEKHTVSRLTGPPPGYIGFESGGQLTEAVRRAPHSVVLFDEIEKAHEDVLNILLQIMEDGILTDGKGRTVNFKNTVIVMTSNVGSRRILELSRSDRSSTQVESIAADDDGINGVSIDEGSMMQVEEQRSLDPIRPEEALRRIQNNPKATTLLMQASSDPEIMGAIRTAMNGSPADLKSAAQANPVIAKFLQDIWGTVSDDSPGNVMPAPKSGLDAIRGSVQKTMLNLEASSVRPSDKWTVSSESAETSTFGASAPDHVLYPRLLEVVKEELEAAMKPELLNRIDEIVVFSPLSSINLELIATLNIDKIVRRATEEHSLDLQIFPDLRAKIALQGSANADQFGARPMRRATQRYIEDSLSDAIIQGFVAKGDKATLSLAPLHADGRDRVLISVNNKSLEVEIADASGGIGRNTFKPAPINGATSMNQVLRTEPER